jgi:phage baseplate assembly protein W
VQTFAVVDGDLVLSSGTLLTVFGANKVKQDLYFALHEDYGTDRYHPLWGSILGRFIGQPLTASTRQSVLNEVQRVLRNYMSVQADQVNASSTQNTKGTVATSEVVSSIEAITVNNVGDNLLISVTLQTMAGQTLTLQRQVTS